MVGKSEQRRQMAGYFLGEMSDEERARFEEQYASDRDLFEELVDVENDLVDSYARGRLTEPERRQFEIHYLATPKRRMRTELAKSLTTHFSGVEQDVSVPDHQDSNREFPGTHRTLAAFRPYIPTMRMGVAIVLCLGLAGTLWIVLLSNQRLHRDLTQVQAEQANLLRSENVLRQQVAALTRQLQEAIPSPGTPPVPAAEVAVLTLAPGLARSGEEENKVVIRPGIAEVRLQLKLDRRRFETYRVSLETPEGIPVWRTNRLSSFITRAHGRIVRVELSAEIFKDSDYILRLDGMTTRGGKEAVDAYTFRVVRQ